MRSAEEERGTRGEYGELSAPHPSRLPYSISAPRTGLTRPCSYGLMRFPHVGEGGSCVARTTGFAASCFIASATARSSCAS